MKDSKLDESLRSAKPEIQPKGAFTAQVIERIGAIQAPRHGRRFVNSWMMWVATTTAVFAVVAVVLIMPNHTQDQAIKNPQESQTNTEIGGHPDNKSDSGNSASNRYEQLAQSTQENIDTITRELSAIDAAEYDDVGLSESSLYH